MPVLTTFENIANIRDLGGMPAASGRAIKSGHLIRSGKLYALTENDAAQLRSLVDTVIDLRSTEEQKLQPDPVVDGIAHITISIVEDLKSGITREKESDREIMMHFLKNPAGAKEYMKSMYRDFVKDEVLFRYREFFRVLADDHERAVLWHCTAGKDRAGIAAVLTEEILGVPREAILADYLKTNESMKKDILGMKALIGKLFSEELLTADETLQYLLGAETEYLEAFYAAAEEKYGSIEGLIRDGLGIGDEERQALQERYLD